MATEKQIAANRANAKHSTGPKTAQGRLKCSRNAYRHGLSCTLQINSVVWAKVRAITQVLVGEKASDEHLISANEFALAQLKLLQIRSARAELMAAFGPGLSDTQGLRRLLALDRYESSARGLRRRAHRKLSLLDG